MLMPWGRNWYDRIDDALYLGERPTTSVLDEVEDVGMVLNLTETFDNDDISHHPRDITHIHMPPSSRMSSSDLYEIVGIIQAYYKDGISTYMHDTYRGSVAALAWMAFVSRNEELATLNRKLCDIRPQISSSLYKNASVMIFYEALDRS